MPDAKPVKSDAVLAYLGTLPPRQAAIGKVLRREIQATLPKAVARIYHRAPAWFIEENAVVGFGVAAGHIRLLFWNGQKLKEPALEPLGNFNAAQLVIEDVAEIDRAQLRRCFKKAGRSIWDFKGLRAAGRSPTARR